MEILREENGVYMTPYNQEQFGMICNFVQDFNCPIHERSITEENIDRIYEYLMNAKRLMSYVQRPDGEYVYQYVYGGMKECFELAKDIPSEIMKQFIISYANLDATIIATRKVVERQSMSIDMSSIPTDLDMNDYEAVWAFADGHADENEDDYSGDDTDAFGMDDIEVRCRIFINLVSKLFEYENVSQIVEETA